MAMSDSRAYRAGETIEDYCRACKLDRTHTVIVADSSGRPLRVDCDYCHSQHNYRGGPRTEIAERSHAETAEEQRTQRTRVTGDPHTTSAAGHPSRASSAISAPLRSPREISPRSPLPPLVSERERIAPPMSVHDSNDLEMLLRRIIREEAGLTAAAPAQRWRGGTMVLRPGAPGLQEKTWPIETFFHKVVMLRNRLRTLEQHVNASELPEDAKLKLQGYISGCYGSLTSFNLLFAEEDDQFKGTGGD
jgi:hypothetical protein